MKNNEINSIKSISDLPKIDAETLKRSKGERREKDGLGFISPVSLRLFSNIMLGGGTFVAEFDFGWCLAAAAFRCCWGN